MSKFAWLGIRAGDLLGKTKLTILSYHRINEVTDGFLFDEDVVSAEPSAFEREMKFCKKNFNPITFSYLKKCIDGKETLPSYPLIITFDDGYRDNFTYAFPILQRLGVPATIFLTVHNVETGENFWWDELNHYLKSKKNAQKPDIRSLLRLLKTIPNRERIERIKELKDTTKLNLERQVLTWEEIIHMANSGVEFGSHTMTHPVLSMIENKTDIEYELKQSKEIIEDKLGKEVIAFSYPIGGKGSFNSKIKEIVKETGYSFAVGYMHGVNYLNNGFDRFSLHRLDMDQESLDRFKAKLAFPGVFKR